MTLKMLPGFSSEYLADVDLPDTEHGSNLFLCDSLLPKGADEQDILFGELGRVDVLTPVLPTLAYRIKHIVPMGSKAQMGGVNTYATVARMQNVKSAGRPMVDAIREDVGTDIFAVEVYLPVPMGVKRTRPVPAPLIGRITGQKPRKDLGLRQSCGPDFFDRRQVALQPSLTVMSTTQLLGHHCFFAAGCLTVCAARRKASRNQLIANMFWGLLVALWWHALILLQYPGLKPKNFLGAALQRAITESKPDIQKLLMGALTGGINA